MRLRFLFVVLLMAGCAGLGPMDGPPFAPITPVPAGKATVYVYYPVKVHMFSQWADVFLNGEKKFALGNRGYGVFNLPPGEYEIKVEGDPWKTNWGKFPATRTLAVEAGHEYYVRVFIEMKSGPLLSAVINAHTRITLVPKEKALIEIAETHLHQ